MLVGLGGLRLLRATSWQLMPHRPAGSHDDTPLATCAHLSVREGVSR